MAVPSTVSPRRFQATFPINRHKSSSLACVDPDLCNGVLVAKHFPFGEIIAAKTGLLSIDGHLSRDRTERRKDPCVGEKGEGRKKDPEKG